ncbi:hypothetical protein ACLI1A_06235 [Flavobacterium sp. RHBU_3]|uniref:hypothetical protein n=1 Tax=Flavobacterium sp. RHBU_3 TaxID=3391184 RepID=UPI0039850586
MKKFLIISAILFCFSGSNAFAFNSAHYRVIFQEKEYKKIKVSDVSADALQKIKKQYGNYTIKEAYKADDGEYKLVLTKDGVDLTATFTPAGDLIKIY